MDNWGDGIKIDTPVETVKVIGEDGSIEYRWLKILKPYNIEEDITVEEGVHYKLEKPGMYECRRCGAVIHSNPGKPVFCTACNRTSTFKEITPQPIVGYWDDIPFREINPIELDIYESIYKLLEDTVILKDEQEYMAMTLAIIGSWKIECFPSYPYLLYMGTIESGKTRALDLVRLLSYHGISAGAISLPAMTRLIELYKATLTEDEAQVTFDIRNSEGRETLKIYKVGYRRGQKYIIADKENPDRIIARDVYSFKAIASEKSLDAAIQSRSIIFWMEEAEPKIRDLAEIEKLAEPIRGKLLYYRYFQPEPLTLQELGVDIGLRGRIEEIFTPLFRVAYQLGVDPEPLKIFARKQKMMKLQELNSGIDTTILYYLYDQTNQIELPTKIYIKDIATFCELDTRAVGRKMKDLHIIVKHGRDGNYISLEDEETIERLKYLYKKFDITQEAVEAYKELVEEKKDRQTKLGL